MCHFNGRSYEVFTSAINEIIKEAKVKGCRSPGGGNKENYQKEK